MVIRRCARLVEHKLELNNISLELDLEDDLPPAHGDAAQLEQLFLALVMNAIEAMEHEGCLRLSTRGTADGREVIAAVADDGAGIPADLLPRLFEPFVTTKEHSHGVGLGLAISRNIIDRHHGKIEVQSEPGRGTCFTIRVPAARPVAGSTRTAAGGERVSGGLLRSGSEVG
jgi:two-component system NtrC family sensor kinase